VREGAPSTYSVARCLHYRRQGHTAPAPSFSGSTWCHIRKWHFPTPLQIQTSSASVYRCIAKVGETIFRNRVVELELQVSKSHGPDNEVGAGQRESADAVLPFSPRSKQVGGSKSPTPHARPATPTPFSMLYTGIDA
jgi:hypothetical protein